MKNKLFIGVLLISTIGVHAQSLNDYLLMAFSNNPELQAAQYRLEGSFETATEAGSLSNTNLGAGAFISEPETRVGAQKAKVSISQKLPWFGTLSERKNSALYRSKAIENDLDFLKRKLELDVKTAFFELYELQNIENIISEHLVLLNSIEKLALVALESNQTSMVEILKIRMDRNELNFELHTLKEKLKGNRIGFNLLLNRSTDALVNVPDAILNDIEINFFNATMLSENPQLLKFDNLRKSLIHDETVAKKEGMPSFGVGLDYVIVEDRPMIDLADNGKDIFMPMVTLSMPLFSKKYSARQKKIQFEQKALESSKTNFKNQLITDFENSQAKLSIARSSIETQQLNIEEAERALQVLMTGYETGAVDFNQLLEIQRMKLTFQQKKIAAEKNYALQIAVLHYLIKI